MELLRVKEEEKNILRQLLELYEYDFSEYNGGDLNDYGFYGYTYLDHYWTEENRHPFFIKVEGKFAGFVLVNDYTYNIKVPNCQAIAEFFVMRKYRREGVGTQAATGIFDLFPVNWVVMQHPENKASHAFWERVIREYTGGKYRMEPVVTEDWEGQAAIFASRSIT